MRSPNGCPRLPDSVPEGIPLPARELLSRDPTYRPSLRPCLSVTLSERLLRHGWTGLPLLGEDLNKRLERIEKGNAMQLFRRNPKLQDEALSELAHMFYAL